MPSETVPPRATATSERRKVRLGCGGVAVLVILALLVIGIVVGIVGAIVGVIGVNHPATVTMPNFAGKDCKASQAKVDRLFKKREGAYQDDTMAGGSPSICTGNVVVRTDPAAGASVELKGGDSVAVRWWAIEPRAYRWYQNHRRMPNYIGKTLAYDPGLYNANDPTYGFVAERIDYSLVQVPATASGWYEQGAHKIVRTHPAPGKRLAVGQKITFYTQVQRGRWIPTGQGSPPSSGSSNGGGLHFGVCVGTWIFHICS